MVSGLLYVSGLDYLRLLGAMEPGHPGLKPTEKLCEAAFRAVLAVKGRRRPVGRRKGGGPVARAGAALACFAGGTLDPESWGNA